MTWFPNFRKSLSLLIFVIFVGACSGPEPTQVFHGKCELRLNESSGKAQLRVDAISVGYGQAVVNVPCGERRISASLSGYRFFEEYRSVKMGEALELNIELQRLEKPKNFALSRQLIQQARTGQPIDPNAEVLPVEDPLPGSMVVASAQSGAADGAATAAAQQNIAPDGRCLLWCSVDDWR